MVSWRDGRLLILVFILIGGVLAAYASSFYL